MTTVTEYTLTICPGVDLVQGDEFVFVDTDVKELKQKAIDVIQQATVDENSYSYSAALLEEWVDVRDAIIKALSGVDLPEHFEYDTFSLHSYMWVDYAKIENVGDKYFKLSLSIGTDDDFALDIGDDITVIANTRAEAVKKAIKSLEDAKLTWAGSWAITKTDSSGTVTTDGGNYSSRWYDIRDLAINKLRYGVLNFHIGGNQTIKCSLSMGSYLEDKEREVAKAKLTPRERKLLGLR